MARLSRLSAVRHILAVIADTAPLPERADAVLSELSDIVPYDAAQIATWDNTTRQHVTLANRGYNDATRAALNGPRYRADRVWAVVEHSHDPVFWKDCPFDPRESSFYVETLEANGYREGATMLLRGAHGEHLGVLMVSLESPSAPGTPIQEALGLVGTALTPLVDRLAPARQFAALTAPTSAATALDNDRGWMPLTAHPLPPPALLCAAQQILCQNHRPIRFYWNNHQQRTRRDRDLAIAVELHPIRHPTCRAVLFWRSETVPFELTRRERDVLAGLARGLSNAEIAAHLTTSVRTVSTHVEHVLNKLGVTTRTAAALLADRKGLTYIDDLYVI
jgi:DNA-binding CsgD family transcriptional regulator